VPKLKPLTKKTKVNNFKKPEPKVPIKKGVKTPAVKIKKGTGYGN